MRCKTARAVDLIHGDAPDSLQRKEERKILKRDPTEKNRNFKTWMGSCSILNFTEGQGRQMLRSFRQGDLDLKSTDSCQ